MGTALLKASRIGARALDSRGRINANAEVTISVTRTLPETAGELATWGINGMRKAAASKSSGGKQRWTAERKRDTPETGGACLTKDSQSSSARAAIPEHIDWMTRSYEFGPLARMITRW